MKKVLCVVSSWSQEEQTLPNCLHFTMEARYITLQIQKSCYITMYWLLWHPTKTKTHQPPFFNICFKLFVAWYFHIFASKHEVCNLRWEIYLFKTFLYLQSQMQDIGSSLRNLPFYPICIPFVSNLFAICTLFL